MPFSGGSISATQPRRPTISSAGKLEWTRRAGYDLTACGYVALAQYEAVDKGSPVASIPTLMGDLA